MIFQCCRTGDIAIWAGLNQKCENIQILVEPQLRDWR